MQDYKDLPGYKIWQEKKPVKIKQFPKEGCKECVKEMIAVGPEGFPKNNCGYCGARLRWNLVVNVPTLQLMMNKSFVLIVDML